MLSRRIKHIKASVKVLKVWLNSPDVAGPIAQTVAPIAAAFGVAPVEGAPDEKRPGVGFQTGFVQRGLLSEKRGCVALQEQCGTLALAHQRTTHPPPCARWPGALGS